MRSADPIAHTCFNRIDLPPYATYEELSKKLSYSVDETVSDPLLLNYLIGSLTKVQMGFGQE